MQRLFAETRDFLGFSTAYGRSKNVQGIKLAENDGFEPSVWLFP